MKIFLAMLLIMVQAMFVASAENKSIDKIVKSQMRGFKCSTFLSDHEYTEKCRIKMMVKVKAKTQWQKLACYGEIEYKQHGATTTLGFLTALNQNAGIPWPNYFPVNSAVFFTKEMQASSTKMAWSTCSIIE